MNTFSGYDSFPSPYLKGDLPGRVPLALSLADKTSPDALTTALLQMRSFSRCRRHSVLRAVKSAGARREARGPLGVVVTAEAGAGACGWRWAPFRSLRTLRECATSRAPRRRALATGFRGGAGSVEPSATHGSSHAGAAPATWATQDRQAGEDSEFEVRLGGIEADPGRGVPSPPGWFGGLNARLRPLPLLLLWRLFCFSGFEP